MPNVAKNKDCGKKKLASSNSRKPKRTGLFTRSGEKITKDKKYYTNLLQEVVCFEVKKGHAVFHTPDYEAGHDEQGYYLVGQSFSFSRKELLRCIFASKEEAIRNKIETVEEEISYRTDLIKKLKALL